MSKLFSGVLFWRELLKLWIWKELVVRLLGLLKFTNGLGLYLSFFSLSILNAGERYSKLGVYLMTCLFWFTTGFTKFTFARFVYRLDTRLVSRLPTLPCLSSILLIGIFILFSGWYWILVCWKVGTIVLFFMSKLTEFILFLSSLEGRSWVGLWRGTTGFSVNYPSLCGR